MSTITNENLKIKNITSKTKNVIKKHDIFGGAKVTLKIMLLGKNTGESVCVTNTFMKNEMTKKEFIRELEKVLGRDVDFGTRHLYIGDKLY